MSEIITDEMVQAGVDEIRKAKHTCFDRWTDHDAIRAVLTEAVGKEIAKLREENERLREALEECEDYFDNRADADCDQDGFIPNKEMQLLTTVRAALKEPTP